MSNLNINNIDNESSNNINNNELNIILDFENMIGKLSLQTPKFVTFYIARFYRSDFEESYCVLDNYYNSLLNDINTKREKLLNENTIDISNTENIDEINLRKIIRFISPFSSSQIWTTNSIIEGLYDYNSYSNFTENKTINNLTFGSKTSENPQTLNEIIVYKICQVNSYPMDKNTTLDELIFFIKHKYTNRMDSLRISLINKIINMDDITLSRTFHNTSSFENIEYNDTKPTLPEVKKVNVNYDNSIIQLTFNNLNENSKLLERILPKNNYEAIIVAAKCYKINITKSISPLNELKNIRCKKTYTPFCNSFCKLYFYNKNWFNISKTWSEDFSPFLYTNEELNSFVINEGFQMTSKSSSKELDSFLRYAKTINTFYFCKIPNCIDITYTLTDNLDNINDDELICFGCFKTNIFIYIYIDELIEFFEINKIYIDPINNEPLEEIAIRKLKNQCEKMFSINQKYEKLKLILEDMDNTKRAIDNKFIELKIALKNEDEYTNSLVKEFFLSGIEMGFIMRGKGIKDNVLYPLSSEDSYYENGENNCNKQAVFYNIIKHKNNLEKIFLQIPSNISEIIKSLHTLKFTKSASKSLYLLGIKSLCPTLFIEATLFDCIDKIYKNIDDDHYADGCVRTNSNWILFSFTWYSLMLGYELPFKIDKIDIIS